MGSILRSLARFVDTAKDVVAAAAGVSGARLAGARFTRADSGASGAGFRAGSTGARLAAARFIVAGFVAAGFAAEALASPVVVGDRVPESLTGVPGDPVKGRTIVATRQVGLCLLCHTGPIAEEKFQGTLAPDLSGAGSRLDVAQLRLRMVDSRRINPSSIMPAYFRSDGFSRVGAQWQGKTILSAQQVEDVVAYLATLKQ